MRRRFGTLLAGAAVAGSAISGCAPQDSGDKVTLRISDGWSAKHPISTSGTIPFLKHLEEEGKKVGISIDYFAVGQLGKPREALTLLRTGALDIAPVVPAYNANELPLASVSELPGLVKDTCAGVRALTPMIRPGGILYEKQIKQYGVRPIWSTMISGYEVFTSEKKVTSPNSLVGLMIRTPGGIVDRLTRQLGAAPVQIEGPDLYEAVARQTVSGAVLSPLSVTSYSLQEVLKYSTLGANLTTTTIMFSISDRTWERLNEAQRKVVMDASAIADAGACKGLAAATQKATETVRKAGVEFTEVTGPVKVAWDKQLEPIRDNWVNDLESIGLPARAVRDDFEKHLAEEQR